MSQLSLLRLGNIAAVPQRSPRRARKRTPWHPQPDGTASTIRSGGREWFSDRLFVESHDEHAPAGYGASVVIHLLAAAGILAFILSRPVQSIVVRMESLAMPAFATQPPPMPQPDMPLSRKAASPSKAETAAPAAVAAPRAGTSEPAKAPVEAPSEITAETGNESQVVGVESGVAGGIAGGAVGGMGTAPAGAPGPAAAVVRAGESLRPPRKIRDVKPIYPEGALPLRAQGAVVIDAIIGADGRVQEVKLLHSVASLLDEAALTAVRQWVYEPTSVNGAPVVVVMTVVVNFSLQ